MDFEFGEKAEQLMPDIRQFVKEELGEDHCGLLFNEEHFDAELDISLYLLRAKDLENDCGGSKENQTPDRKEEHGAAGYVSDFLKRICNQ